MNLKSGAAAVGMALSVMVGAFVAHTSNTNATPTKSVTVSGPISGSGSTVSDVKALLLGEPLSVQSLILTQNDTNACTITFAAGRMCLFPGADEPNVYMEWNPNLGAVSTPKAFAVGQGAPVMTDVLVSRQGGTPVAIGEAYGLRLACQNALPGDCGVGTVQQGTQVALCATSTSRTRICTCTASSNTSPTNAWALGGGSGTVGTASTCPEVTP